MLRPARQLLALLLAAVLYTGGGFSWACSSETCHASTICTAVHCSCCCDGCVPSTAAQKTPKPAAPSGTKCPLLGSMSTPVVSRAVSQPMTLAVFDAAPILFASRPPVIPLIQVGLHPSGVSLLSLGCALTI